jgi:hypothetical protein
MQGLISLATSNNALTFLVLSPCHFDNIEDVSTHKKFIFDSPANAWMRRVFPTPEGCIMVNIFF